MAQELASMVIIFISYVLLRQLPINLEFWLCEEGRSYLWLLRLVTGNVTQYYIQGRSFSPNLQNHLGSYSCASLTFEKDHKTQTQKTKQKSAKQTWGKQMENKSATQAPKFRQAGCPFGGQQDAYPFPGIPWETIPFKRKA